MLLVFERVCFLEVSECEACVGKVVLAKSRFSVFCGVEIKAVDGYERYSAKIGEKFWFFATSSCVLIKKMVSFSVVFTKNAGVFSEFCEVEHAVVWRAWFEVKKC